MVHYRSRHSTIDTSGQPIPASENSINSSSDPCEFQLSTHHRISERTTSPEFQIWPQKGQLEMLRQNQYTRSTAQASRLDQITFQMEHTGGKVRPQDASSSTPFVAPYLSLEKRNSGFCYAAVEDGFNLLYT